MKKEKIRVKKEQAGLLKQKLKEVFLAGRKEGTIFGEFPSFRSNPDKLVQEALKENFLIE